jgi:hypothetical protein
MHMGGVWVVKRLMIFGALVFACLLALPAVSNAFSRAQRQEFQRSIVDYRAHLNPRYEKIKRPCTKYIIVHTSELGLQSTLRVVSQGKQFRNGRCTFGGHTHYVIARNGRTYRIMDIKYRADHAGVSMWNGKTDLSNISIGIELVGYHYSPLSEQQYRSVGMLIEILQDIYHLDDGAVLTHSQIAYGLPNPWFRKDHRGRKRCAKNFIRSKAGLGPTWAYDPDVKAGRLMADAQLADVFYSRRPPVAPSVEENIISKQNTAWNIAGEDFDSPTTVYKFPDGRLYNGAQIASNNGWNQIPAKTVVLLNQEITVELVKDQGAVKTITRDITAWSLAGHSYNHEDTIYFLPSGGIKTGSMISDWDDLPMETKMIIGYKGPYELRGDRSAYRIAGHNYNDRKTIYYLPSKELLGGNMIKDFSRLKEGTLVFLPADKG